MLSLLSASIRVPAHVQYTMIDDECVLFNLNPPTLSLRRDSGRWVVRLFVGKRAADVA